MIKFLDLNAQYLSIKREIDNAIQNVISKSSFIGGEYLKKFENNFSKYVNTEFCVGVANGTDAIEIAIESLNLPIGSEILVPSLSFISTSEAVSRQGHKPKFVKFDENNFTISTSDIENKISTHTRAIIAVHLYGQPCDMDKINKIAKKFNLYVIEDCAQSHGAKYKGRPTGSLGDVATFSFYPGKNLGAYGDGGAIVTNNDEIANKCRMIGNHGRITKYEHKFEGRNSRLDGLQAAILDVKLKHLDYWINIRNQLANYYRDNLSGVEDIILPSESINVKHAYHLFVIKTKKRDLLKEYLNQNKIETGIHYPKILPDLLAYKSIHKDDSLEQKNIPNYLLSLPIGENLNKIDLNKITSHIINFFKKN